MSRGWLLIGAAVVVGGLVAACSERPQIVNYKQGTYQGKPDQRPFEGAQFKGNQQEWERAIRTRNQFQNEYKRT
jgi:hypothetical protein